MQISWSLPASAGALFVSLQHGVVVQIVMAYGSPLYPQSTLSFSAKLRMAWISCRHVRHCTYQAVTSISQGQDALQLPVDTLRKRKRLISSVKCQNLVAPIPIHAETALIFKFGVDHVKMLAAVFCSYSSVKQRCFAWQVQGNILARSCSQNQLPRPCLSSSRFQQGWSETRSWLLL
jgi:hypothetical protein